MTAFAQLAKADFRGSPAAEALWRSARRRTAIAQATNAYRLNDENGDELESVVVERYADWAVVSTYSERALARAEELAKALVELGARGVYLKNRVRADLRRIRRETLAGTEPVAGEACPEDTEIHEDGRRYLVRLGDGLSTGLFVDQRLNRGLVQSATRGARVLNLFAYTCSFSVAAGLGGAAQVTSVDLSGAVLRRGAKNIEVNGLDPGRQRLLKSDALVWLERAVRRGELFDWIVLDPPSFSSKGKGSFSVEQNYSHVAEQAMRCLAPQGTLLAVTNHRRTTTDAFARLLRTAAAASGRAIAGLKHLEGPTDCRPDSSGAPSTKSVLLRVG